MSNILWLIITGQRLIFVKRRNRMKSHVRYSISLFFFLFLFLANLQTEGGFCPTYTNHTCWSNGAVQEFQRDDSSVGKNVTSSKRKFFFTCVACEFLMICIAVPCNRPMNSINSFFSASPKEFLLFSNINILLTSALVSTSVVSQTRSLSMSITVATCAKILEECHWTPFTLYATFYFVINTIFIKKGRSPYLVLKVLTDIAQHTENVNHSQNNDEYQSSIGLEGQDLVDHPRQEHSALQQPGRQGLEEAADHSLAEFLNLSSD